MIKDAEHYLAIGDIHGCLEHLDWVLEEVVPTLPVGSQVVFVGDYIDRGIDPAGVVSRLIDFKEKRPDTVFLIGNHEEMLLDALDQGTDEALMRFLLNGGATTMHSYGLANEDVKEIPESHFIFFRDLKLHHQTRDYLFVHAGLRPGVPLEKQDPHDLVWIREEFYGSGEDFGRTVIFGHTPMSHPLRRPGLFGIDTGAVFGNYLTCLLLPEEQFYSYPSPKKKAF